MIGVMDLSGAGTGAVIVLIELLVIMAMIMLTEVREWFEK